MRLHLGLLLKSFIKEKGRAVIPTAPQHANMGYPIRHKIAIKKHGKVAVIYTYSFDTSCVIAEV